MTYPPSEPLSRPVRLAVLISGGGTTLDNFMTRIHAGELSAEVSLVIASRPDCGGIEKAKRHGLPLEVIPRKEFRSVAQFSQSVFEACRQQHVDLVILGGFLSLLEIPNDFMLRVMNIHPSLIPAFCGQGFHGSRVHEAAYERGVKVSGCTVHFADNEYDHGPIILQRTVAIDHQDQPADITTKVFEQECEAYPEAIRLFAEGRLRMEGKRVAVIRLK